MFATLYAPDGLGDAVEAGEMALAEEGGRLLPTALFARWARLSRAP